MAGQAAIALDNANLYYEVNQKLERRVKAFAALGNIGVELTSGIRLKEAEILQLIYNQAQKLTGAQDMYIALYDEDTQKIRFPLATQRGKQVEYPSRKANMEKRGKTEGIIFTREPILHKTMKESENWYRQPGYEEKVGLVQPSWLGVPMMVDERVLGVIAVYDMDREYAYDEQDREVLSLMSSQAAIALDNARLYEEARSEVIAAKQLATLGTAMATLEHRFKNSFNIIIPNINRLRKRVDLSDEEVVEILDIIERNARSTSEIVSRIQKPLQEIEASIIDVNAVLADAVLKVKDEWRSRTTASLISVSTKYDDAIPNIWASIGQISEVFYNLIDNAFKAIPNGGGISVSTLLVGNTIQTRVQDTGTGIPPDVQERLIKKPVPSKVDEKRRGGAGLGLWLTGIVLKSIGGGVTIEKSDSSGTTMLVCIPTSQSFRGEKDDDHTNTFN
jgi:signal transduction histidine kinase